VLGCKKKAFVQVIDQSEHDDREIPFHCPKLLVIAGLKKTGDAVTECLMIRAAATHSFIAAFQVSLSVNLSMTAPGLSWARTIPGDFPGLPG
jgi:hypothetical protein